MLAYWSRTVSARNAQGTTYSGVFVVTQNFQDDTAELGSTATSPNSINSVLYALLTVNFFAAGVGYLYAPTATLEVSPCVLSSQ